MTDSTDDELVDFNEQDYIDRLIDREELIKKVQEFLMEIIEDKE